ncbi:MAG: GNAT family N-acetyltransferase, partial [Ignavibacterium sp.]
MSEFKLTENIFNEKILDFLGKFSGASIYHHPAWLNAIKKALNHKAFYLVSFNNSGEPDGLLPFIEFKDILRRKKIITLPFTTYCNPLIPKEKLFDAISFLQQQISDYRFIDLRFKENYQNQLKDFSVTSEYYTHILTLKNTIEETFNSFHPTSVKASIRRAEKNNLNIVWDNSFKHLNIFYKLEFKLRKRLSLPPIPFKFFNDVFEELSKFNMISLPVVYKDNIPIAAGFILNFKDTFYLEYTAADKNYFNLYPNHKLFFEVIKRAQNSGAKFIDFGRTSIRNTSLITFKEKWAAERIPLYHHY